MEEEKLKYSEYLLGVRFLECEKIEFGRLNNLFMVIRLVR